MRSRWGRLTSGIAILCALALGLWQPAASSAVSCAGRPQLSCTVRADLYYDAVNWGLDGFGSLDMFEAPKTLHLNNPALAEFWHFEAATGLSRYEFEFGIANQGNDSSYETPVAAAAVSKVKIKPSGIVTHHMAFVLSRLLAAEQQEVVNLVAADVALNRATGASIGGRTDWASYQLYSAARFAQRAAAAIGLAIPRQRAVSRALLGARLRFGIGPGDTQAEQRYVRQHGFPKVVTEDLLALGNSSVTVALEESAFTHAKPSTTTYGMSAYLSSATVIRYEQTCARALVSFANSVAPAARPS